MFYNQKTSLTIDFAAMPIVKFGWKLLNSKKFSILNKDKKI